MMANISLQTQQNTNLQPMIQVSNCTTSTSSANKVLIGGHSHHSFASHHHLHRHTLTFPNLETLSHSILTPNATIMNGNKIVVRPVIGGTTTKNVHNNNNKNSTLARIQHIAKWPNQSTSDMIINNSVQCNSTITGGNGNLLLFASNIYQHPTKSLINNNCLVKPKSPPLSSSSSSSTTETMSWKAAKLNNNVQTFKSETKLEDSESIQVSINPKTMFFTQDEQRKTDRPQQSTARLVVNRLNSYHNETLPDKIFDTDDEDDDDDLDMNFMSPYYHNDSLTTPQSNTIIQLSNHDSDDDRIGLPVAVAVGSVQLVTQKQQSNGCDSPKIENGKSKVKKSSKSSSVKRTVSTATTNSRKSHQSRRRKLNETETNEHQQRLQMLQRKRRQVWLQLLPQIIAKKDKLFSARIERKKRLGMMALECKKRLEDCTKTRFD